MVTQVTVESQVIDSHPLTDRELFAAEAIAIRADGFISLTVLAKALRKSNFQVWLKSKFAKAAFPAIALQAGTDVVDTITGRPENGGGTWAHPLVAYHFAVYCDPTMATELDLFMQASAATDNAFNKGLNPYKGLALPQPGVTLKSTDKRHVALSEDSEYVADIVTEEHATRRNGGKKPRERTAVDEFFGGVAKTDRRRADPQIPSTNVITYNPLGGLGPVTHPSKAVDYLLNETTDDDVISVEPFDSLNPLKPREGGDEFEAVGYVAFPSELNANERAASQKAKQVVNVESVAMSDTDAAFDSFF